MLSLYNNRSSLDFVMQTILTKDKKLNKEDGASNTKLKASLSP